MEHSIITPRKRQKLSNGRYLELKPLLPKDWRERLIKHAPEYDSLKGADLLKRVHLGRCFDDKVLDLWQQIVDEYEAEKTEASRRKSGFLKRVKINIPT